MTIIDLSGGCLSPVTITVRARTRRVGLYELAVYPDEEEGGWGWLVLLNDQPQAQGNARSEERAMRAAEAAARRCSAP